MNGDIERDLGILIGKMATLETDVRELRVDIKKLIGFRAWILGGAAGVSTAASLAVKWVVG